ncbi:MAG: ribonuclease H-like domain-containing protein [Deltaproteobacteria bacterium]|nr:ribonuclease H-like domain-containing protein [Deltaproteobacteria bacterium]
MSSFRERLARLHSGARAAVPPVAGPALPAATTDEARLGALRAQLDALGVAGTPAPAARAAFPADLPFEPSQTDLGTLWSRRSWWGPAERVGTVPLGSVLGGDRALVSLLALAPELGRCDLGRALFLDAESTGLGGGAGTIAFLIGLCWHDAAAGGFCFEQLFVPQPGGEAPALGQLSERVAAVDVVVSYNGRSFDLPLLRARCAMNRLPALPERPQLDLLHVARRVHRGRRWPKTLVAVEKNVLQYARPPDDVSGEEVAQRYAHYLRGGDAGGLLPVLSHNALDVRSLVALAGFYAEPLSEGGSAPLGRLAPPELCEVAWTMRRAGELERAAIVADQAARRVGRDRGLRPRPGSSRTGVRSGPGLRARSRSRPPDEPAGRMRERLRRGARCGRARRRRAPARAGQALRALPACLRTCPGARPARHGRVRGGAGAAHGPPRAQAAAGPRFRVGAESRNREGEVALASAPPLG